jgi:hypothetical protein
MEMKYIWKIIATPSCWLRNHPYSAEYDKLVLELLASEKVIHGKHTSTLGNLVVWTENYPYAYGSPYCHGDNILPSRPTVFKLREAVEKSRIMQIKGETK